MSFEIIPEDEPGKMKKLNPFRRVPVEKEPSIRDRAGGYPSEREIFLWAREWIKSGANVVKFTITRERTKVETTKRLNKRGEKYNDTRRIKYTDTLVRIDM